MLWVWMNASGDVKSSAHQAENNCRHKWSAARAPIRRKLVRLVSTVSRWHRLAVSAKRRTIQPKTKMTKKKTAKGKRNNKMFSKLRSRKLSKRLNWSVAILMSVQLLDVVYDIFCLIRLPLLLSLHHISHPHVVLLLYATSLHTSARLHRHTVGVRVIVCCVCVCARRLQE